MSKNILNIIKDNVLPSMPHTHTHTKKILKEKEKIYTVKEC